MVSAALAVVLGLGAAQAEEDPLLFERVQRRGKIGLIAGAAGPPLFILGFGAMGAGTALGSPVLALGGFTAAGAGAAGTLAGGFVLAGASVRGAKLSGADRRLGYATWGLMGATFLTGSATEVAPEAATAIGVAGGLCYAGAMVTGGLQLHKNRLVAEGLAWQLVPTPNGLALAGTF